MPITDNHGEVDLAIYKQLCTWVDTMGKDLVLKAIETGFVSNARSIRYIAKVLYNWRIAGVKTLEALDDYIKGYEERKNGKKSNKVVQMTGSSRSKTNGFHNFEQHDDEYTNEELEKLLGVR